MSGGGSGAGSGSGSGSGTTSGRGRRELRVRVKTAKGRKLSSTRWLERQLNDPYVARAKAEGYRGRARASLIWDARPGGGCRWRWRASMRAATWRARRRAG
jgi:23S rRNA (uridine2552-2'-O)-methyltransferase